MRSLRAQWPRLRRAVAAAPRLLLLLDVDGTLVRIAKHPSLVRLPASTKQLLTQLADYPKVSVVLVSGRALACLKALVGIRNLCYVGNHGLELQGRTWRYVHPVAQRRRPLLRQIARDFTRLLRPIRGAWVEEKGLSLSLHWRQVPRSAQRRFQQLVAGRLALYTRRRRIRVMRGKRVIDIRPPVRWGKGDAVAWLLRRMSRSPTAIKPFMIYVGDDQTDEDAFRVVNRLGGMTVFVGGPARATRARYWLKNPREVHAWLEGLGRLLHQRRAI